MDFLSSRPVKNNGFTTVAKVDSLEGENYIEITEEASGEKIIIPSRFYNGSVPVSLFVDVATKKTEMQREAFHPTKFASNLISSSKSPRGETLALSDSLVIGTPMLVWVSESQRFNINSPVGNQASGWKIELSGITGAPLGFAKWDDVEGINRLVSYLGEREALSIQLALAKPEQAAILYSSDTLVRLIREGSIPPVSQKEMKKSFVDAGLKNQRHKTKIIRLEVTIDGTTTPIALGVMQNTYATRTARFDEHIRTGMSGWIEVEAASFPLSISRGRWSNKWLTRMTQEQWDSISLGVGVHARVGKGNVWF